MSPSVVLYSFFFFQAEDGIRDTSVTGVQTCALPISQVVFVGLVEDVAPYYALADALALPSHSEGSPNEIGRASCRERVEIVVAAGKHKKESESLSENLYDSFRHESRLNTMRTYRE